MADAPLYLSSSTVEYGATLLSVKDVSLTLGGKLILRDVDLTIKDIRVPGRVTGQVVGLLGPSGIGKTQLFKILAGLNAPDTGTVLIGDKGIPAQRGMVGVVAQHYPLFAHRTVLGNLIVAGRQVGLSTADATNKAMGHLTRFRLEEHSRKYPSQLSGGQRQRVAIAQQFMCSENFLLMDEPFSGLDMLAVENLCEFITDVASAHEFNTIITVTHDITAALEVADTIWLFGRDRDQKGDVIPGARVQASYNLIERGLAFRPGIAATAEFTALRKEIRDKFPSL